MAITGPMKGTQLRMLPVSLEPWESWRAAHPDTLVVDINGSFMYAGEAPRSGFVIGVVMGDAAEVYLYEALVRERVINDTVGDTPVLVLADPETRAIRAYVRETWLGALTFSMDACGLVEAGTGSVWDPLLGLVTEAR